MTVTFDQFSESVNVPDGAVSLSMAEKIIDQYVEGQKNSYQSIDDPFAISIFSFRKSMKEFIEIAIDSNSDFRVRYECKHYKRFWFFNFLSTFDKDLYVPEIDNIKDVVRSFYILTNDDFFRYFDSLPYKESKFVAIGTA